MEFLKRLGSSSKSDKRVASKLSGKRDEYQGFNESLQEPLLSAHARGEIKTMEKLEAAGRPSAHARGEIKTMEKLEATGRLTQSMCQKLFDKREANNLLDCQTCVNILASLLYDWHHEMILANHVPSSPTRFENFRKLFMDVAGYAKEKYSIRPEDIIPVDVETKFISPN